jgi:hypothetical protein
VCMGLTVQRQKVQLLVTVQQWLRHHSTVDSKCWQLWCTWERTQYLAIFAFSYHFQKQDYKMCTFVSNSSHSCCAQLCLFWAWQCRQHLLSVGQPHD